MIKNKIIFLNAPSGAGKDTVAEYLSVNFGTKTCSFKEPLFEILAVILNITVKELKYKYNLNRVWKETPQKLLNNLSPRDLFKKISEEWVKPVAGQDYFGKIALEKCDKNNQGIIFSDCGFDEEVKSFVDAGHECLVIQFVGQGVVDFGNDTRNWITEASGAKIIKLSHFQNDSTVELFVNKLIPFICEDKFSEQLFKTSWYLNLFKNESEILKIYKNNFNIFDSVVNKDNGDNVNFVTSLNPFAVYSTSKNKILKDLITNYQYFPIFPDSNVKSLFQLFNQTKDFTVNGN